LESSWQARDLKKAFAERGIHSVQRRHRQQEAVIGGITEPSGGRHYFGALMLGVYDKGWLQYVGHTGTGFSEALLKNLFEKLTPYFTEKCPFTPKTKADATVKLGRAQVRLRGRIPGVDKRQQNESAEFSKVGE
jgi:ATP-dependent DNA ligase